MSSFRLRVCHPLWSVFPYASPNCSTATSGSYNPRRQAPWFGLFRFRSPLLTESLSISFPPVTEMFHFTGSRSATPMYSEWSHPVLNGWGYPIRKSPDHSVFAAPRSLSQLITSFFACWHQGIHHVLLVACSILRLKNLLFLMDSLRCGNCHGSTALQTQHLKLHYFALYADVKELSGAFAPDRSSELVFPIQFNRENSKRVQMVGLIGLEPMTLRLSSACSNQLSYRPF